MQTGNQHPSFHIVAIVQARMGSTRLPGKVLKTVLGKSLLEHQMERLQHSRLIHQLVVATSVEQADEEIVRCCDKHDIPVYRGSEEDVLSRYFETATTYGADVIVRLTADCPLIDPQVVDQVISVYLEHEREIDYVSNTLERTYPRGLDTEVFSYSALKKANDEAEDPVLREHVTPYIYQHPERFRLLNVACEHDHSQHRWTVDTREDFEFIQKIIERLGAGQYGMEDVLNVLRLNPEWVNINAHVQQKPVIS